MQPNPSPRFPSWPPREPVHTPAATALAGALLMLASSFTPAHAAEGGVQRYTPGIGGSDMTASLSPGWYGQVALLHYHATQLKNNSGQRERVVAGGQAADAATLGAGMAAGLTAAGAPVSALAPLAGTAAAQAFPNGIGYQTRLDHVRADATVVLPRITYLSTQQVFGANLGFTAMVPLVTRQNSVALSNSFTPSAPNPVQVTGDPTSDGVLNSAAAAAQGAVQGRVHGAVAREEAGQNGSASGLSDLEIAPLLLWNFGDHQSLLLAPTLILPTGQFGKGQGVNTGFGQYYTFRPSVQYSYIGDGWDVGARAIVSFNTRNRDTDYRTGTLFNLDAQLMAFVSEDLRLGLQGYAISQLTRDTSRVASAQAAIDAAGGNKMRGFALGPAVAWVVRGGEAMVEGKVLQEFGARNRTQGVAWWLTLSKPLDL